jgi:hypothetical protein
MTEREMEDLIWHNPEKFLNEPLTQFQRQPSSTVGRADLIFEDRIGRLLVIELKRDTLERGAVMQLIDYYGMVKSRFPGKAVELMVVAARIPPERKVACEQYDITAVEIPHKKFRDVADEVGYVFKSESTNSSIQPADRGRAPCKESLRTVNLPKARLSFSPQTGLTVEEPSVLRWTRTGYNVNLVDVPQFDSQRSGQLIDAFELAVPSRRNARLVRNLREWASMPTRPFMLSDSQSLLRWVITSGWKAAVPHATELWQFLFGLPAPEWYVWNGSKYDFDVAGWTQWFNSLPH